MSKRYELNDVAVFNITWLDQTGQEINVSGTPTIQIDRWDNVNNVWDSILAATNMTQKSGGNWYHEYDTSGQTANYDYKILYNAYVSGPLFVEAAEDFRIVDIVEEIRQVKKGNNRYDFTYSGTRLTNINVLTKTDSASDWSSPTGSKMLYFTYNASNQLTSVGSQ